MITDGCNPDTHTGIGIYGLGALTDFSATMETQGPILIPTNEEAKEEHTHASNS